MVITSPFSSIRGFVATRPPLVLFTLCLIAFAITTFTFAYYVEHKTDLPNLDAHRDWKSFLSFLSKKKMCLSSSESPTISSTNLNLKNESDYITVSVLADLSSNLSLQNVSYVHGYITTQDWASECPFSSPPNRVKISYYLFHDNHSSNTLMNDVCVSLYGPRELLEPAVKETKCKEYTPQNGIWSITDKNSDVCNEGISTLLHYTASLHNAAMLTLHDRSIINLHLFHTSYFLLVMAITLICYAMIKGKPVVKHQPLDKVPMDA